MLMSLKEKFGRLDILFANAGIAKVTAIEDSTEAAFDEVLRTNLTSVFFTIQAALPLLGSGASIVLNGSVAETLGFPGMSSYSASKAALRAMSRCLAGELAPRGIRINVVAPGPINTPIWGREPLPPTAVKIANKMHQAVPLARFGEPEEVAKAVLFLASNDSSYITSSEIVVDGGMTGAIFGAPVYQS